MNKSRFQSNVARTHHSPSEVLNDHSLSQSQKLKVLEDWKLDLLERLKATEENMPDTKDQSGDVSEELRQISDALHAIQSHQPNRE